ncbi:MAG: hypothetical protein UV82_C0002G0087 [Candidatus Magasanikbacteria bacterium GW2011_GWD2_43_18]|uniref:Uncharacterized protein n=1 Tax=Candidatus Magasanikbacteria bacterium GW2011_GWE2_42_7 TaxID=1619052 RepID=A0A0G1BGV0_9BACT|nr:MAG: hypothetical protein UV18_C0003G0087 [Candidatus Magasanikbacteria bacterium GW2011_GWC2_42_27]KKS72610.1 MAG: hypothetical protein UV42_C0006G0010 [Candidatus Magasanikbacteria bacterium GW2011_GWE2_42_7]KKT05117.1 MAG: hypothetical protein UV82_C0002G0087 [Candidatus Magasanikbacteria bacterium GW2011_GWD2_43_18]KKT25792.1 MAG: hypothetical protein UW10_C0004G0067 [Candidatus Magasanikbacteria bacterium GW2011_GWA2_43_9]HBB38077.1 hypothetical protein [Candidatus Magasanikbacteria bac
MLARITYYKQVVFRYLSKVLPKRKRNFFVIQFFLALAVIGIFGAAIPVQAAGFFTDLINGLFSFFSWVMFILARLFVGLTIFALKFFIEVASYNNFIDTPTVKIGWYLVRDVANMFFVVVLLVISFGTILGLEQYEWKKTLVKLVFAAIFINFSNMIAQLIIDVAQVFTITFVNALSATAGGNIINMFNIDTMYNITGAEKFGEGSDLKIETFAASVTVFFLALIMMTTMGAFAIVMVARMVILWVLIIMSPLAYIFQVIPQTQKYAQEWWSMFTNHVIVAPVMVFFLWLSFATLGTGNSGAIDLSDVDLADADTAINTAVNSGAGQKLSISEATSWENLANYLIAIAFLLVGLRAVRNLGVVAGGLTSSAIGFAKNVATIATGASFARGAYNRGRDLAKKKTDEALFQPVRDWAKRTKSSIDDKRKTIPYFRAIPFIGLKGSMRRKKLNEEAERSSKLIDENFEDTISRKENISAVDRFGKWMKETTGAGFGIEVRKTIRYKLEKEQDRIQEEKAKAKETRKAEGDEDVTSKADGAIQSDEAIQKIEKDHEKALGAYIESSSKFGDAGKDDAWVKEHINEEALKAQAAASLKNETEEQLSEEFRGTAEGKKMADELKTLAEAIAQSTTAYKKSYLEFLAGLAQDGTLKAEDFDDDSRKLIAEARKLDPSKEDSAVISELMKDGSISLKESKEKKHFDAFKAREGKESYDALLAQKATQDQHVAAYTRAFDAYQVLNGPGTTLEARQEAAFSQLDAVKQVDDALETLASDVQEAALEYSSAYQAFLTNLAASGEVELADLDEESQKLVLAEKGAHEGMTEEQAIASLMKDGLVSLSEDSYKAMDELFNGTEGAEVFDKKNKADEALQAKKAERAEAFGLWRDQSPVAAQVAASLKKDEQKNEAAVDARAVKLKQELVDAENVTRRKEGAFHFAGTDTAKKLAKDSEKAINKLADNIGVGKVIIKDKEGNPLDAAARQAIAEKIRFEVKKKRGAVAVAKQKASEATVEKTMLGTQFGDATTNMELAAGKVEAAAKSFAESFRNDKIAANLEKAAEKIQKAMEAGAEKGADALKKALAKDPYAQASMESELLIKSKEVMTQKETVLNETAKAYRVEKPELGDGTPSTANVPIAERLANDLKSQEAGDAATFAKNVLSHLLLAKKKGSLSTHQKASLMGIGMHVGKNGWFDDVISEVGKNLDKLRAGEFDGDKDQKEKMQNMRDVFVDQLGIIKLDKTTGKFKKISDYKRIARLQSLMVSGGDTDAIRDHAKNERVQEAVKKSKTGTAEVDGVTYTKDDTYGIVLDKMEKAGQLFSVTADRFKQKMAQSGEFLQEASSFFKREAINVGHQEYGAHFQWDGDMGAYRMATMKEAEDLMAAEARKFKGKLKWQYHGLGEADLDKGRLMKVNSTYANNQLEELTSAGAAKSMAERTIDAIMGYSFGEKINMNGDFAVIGGSMADIKDTYGDLKTYLKDVILPLVRSNTDVFNFAARQKAKHVDELNSNRGKAFIQIGDTNIKGETNSEFLSALLRQAVAAGIASQEDVNAMRQGISASRKREEALPDERKKRKQSTSPVAPPSPPTTQDDEDGALLSAMNETRDT